MRCKYGVLEGIYSLESYENGNIQNCTLSEKNILDTEYGHLIPQYDDSEERKRTKLSLEFYENGTMEKIYLQEPAELKTEAGVIPAETVMFHENGSIKKIFPLDGHLSGFWTQDKEYKLAKDLNLKTPVGEICAKVISISFYDSGKLKSITFWPGEIIKVETPVGLVTARTGIAFYESGSIKSLEPATKVKVDTPMGEVIAFDISPLGVHGDINSLAFYEDGSVKYLYTSTDEITVESEEGIKIYSPGTKIGMCSDEKRDLVPLKIGFESEKVYFEKKSNVFEMGKYEFKVRNYATSTDGFSLCCD